MRFGLGACAWGWGVSGVPRCWGGWCGWAGVQGEVIYSHRRSFLKSSLSLSWAAGVVDVIAHPYRASHALANGRLHMPWLLKRLRSCNIRRGVDTIPPSISISTFGNNQGHQQFIQNHAGGNSAHGKSDLLQNCGFGHANMVRSPTCCAALEGTRIHVSATRQIIPPWRLSNITTNT